MYLKVHRTPAGDEVVAVCDRELLDTRIQHGDIEIHVSEAFYGKSPATPEEVRTALRYAGNVNLIGERTIALAIEMGLIGTTGFIRIGSVPHAQIIRL
ncbi:MAG: DUF424 domain-containing protein [Methanoregulaceae archaeon]|jgi:hypothetical protein|nr:DUF424 domain-containing protein [Methanoregulaceae archaeon]